MKRLLLVALLPALGCAGQPASRSADLFSGLEHRIGEEVQVDGYALYRFENHNLYPTANWRKHHLNHACIPLGVLYEDEAAAERLDGSRVRVTGRVELLLEADEIAASWCKKVGILVTSISPAPAAKLRRNP